MTIIEPSVKAWIEDGRLQVRVDLKSRDYVRDEAGRFAETGGQGDVDPDNPESWPKYDVGSKAVHDLYHVTLADNLSGIQKNGFISKDSTSMGEPVDTDRIFFATNREQAESIVSQMMQVSDEPVAMIKLKCPAKMLGDLDPRVDWAMPESSIAVKPSKKLHDHFFLGVEVTGGGESLIPSKWKPRSSELKSYQKALYSPKGRRCHC
jgi:hypothetical protein